MIEWCSSPLRLFRRIKSSTPRAMRSSAPTPQPTPTPIAALLESPELLVLAPAEEVCETCAALDEFDALTEAEVEAAVDVADEAEETLGVTVADVAVGVLPDTQEMVPLTARGRAARFSRVALSVKSGCLPWQLHCLLAF